MSDPFDMFNPFALRPMNYDPRARSTMTTPPTQTVVLPGNPPEVVDALEVKIVQLDPKLPEPVYLTRHLLRCLGSCSEYLRKFNDQFPPSDVRWQRGAPITQELCAEYASSYDWEWAANVMLTYDGQRLVERLRGSRTAENRTKFGTGRVRRAAVFGHVLHTHPEYRSEQLVRALRQQVEQADELELKDFREAESELKQTEETISYNGRRIVEYQQAIKNLEARLPDLRAEVERRRLLCRDILRRVQERAVEEATAEVTRVQALLETVRQTADAAQRELKELKELNDREPATDATADDSDTNAGSRDDLAVG